jgi:pyruvate dehydrogenase E1 component beta subunit
MYGNKGEVDTALDIPLGKARIAREGSDATIVTYGATVATSIEAARSLEKENIQVEVVDLRSLQPWDEQAVFASVARTHRVVVVHEAVQAFGVGAEIAARIAEGIFYELDAPVMRVGAPFMPSPFARPLEKQYQVSSQGVADAVRATLA